MYITTQFYHRKFIDRLFNILYWLCTFKLWRNSAVIFCQKHRAEKPTKPFIYEEYGIV